MKLIYTGRHGAVDVTRPDGSSETVAWGDVFTTTTEHAESLLEQPDNWQAAPAPAAREKKAAQTAPAEETKE